MKLCISHMSAFRWYMRNPSPRAGASAYFSLDQELFDAPTVTSTRVLRQYLSVPDSDQLHLAVLSKDQRRCMAGTISHLLSTETPRNSFIRIGTLGNLDIYAPRPELLFLQLCAVLKFDEAVYCGMALCANYMTDSTEESGIILRSKIPNPLIKTTDIDAYLALCDGICGAKKARHVLKYVVENSFSPMETGIAMVYHLPVYYGGFGFKDLSLNKELNIGRRSRQLDKVRRKPDISIESVDGFGQKRIAAIDYDSSAVHDCPSVERLDGLRRNTFASSSGLSYFVLTKRQALEFGAFCNLAEQVRLSLNMRPREQLRVSCCSVESKQKLQDISHKRFGLWAKFVCSSNFRKSL